MEFEQMWQVHGKIVDQLEEKVCDLEPSPSSGNVKTIWDKLLNIQTHLRVKSTVWKPAMEILWMKRQLRVKE